MAYIHARQRWKRPPSTERLEVNWGNALANLGLMALVSPAPFSSLRNLVDGKQFTVTTNNASFGYRQAGKSFTHATTNSAYSIALPQTIPSGTGARYSAGIFSAWNEGPQFDYQFDPSANADVSTDWPNIGRFRHWGGGTLRTVGINGSDRGAAFIGGYDGTNAWVVGPYAQSVGADSALNGSLTTLTLLLGWDGQGMSKYTGLVAVFNQSLYGPPAQAFVENPWQLFRPISRRIFVNTAAAAAGGGPFPMFTPPLRGGMRQMGGGMQG